MGYCNFEWPKVRKKRLCLRQPPLFATAQNTVLLIAAKTKIPMRKIAFLIFMVLSFPLMTMGQQSFKSEQLRYKSVRRAYAEKEAEMKRLLMQHDLKPETLEIFIRVIKNEKLLELWGKNKNEKKFRLITTYDFCMSSGVLGPKLKRGDKQIPEGFYYINAFNPNSKFDLSLGINYPNPADLLRGTSDPGGDIFIHGGCETKGCIPITNDKIRELYLFAVEARNNGQSQIPVHIFPARLTAMQMDYLKKAYRTKPELIRFWIELQLGFDYFEKNKTLP
jgi:murein L,D-transpeptidase YafK